MRIIVVGDTHGDATENLSVKSIQRATRHGAEAVIQCGDFGLWDHNLAGIEFLDVLNESARKADIPFVWLDGNHENHDRLAWYVKNNPKNKHGMTYIRSHILYSPRGNHWEWDNKRFMTVGGAVSIDKESRLYYETHSDKYGPRTLWWPGEALTDAQADGIVANMNSRRAAGKPGVDYLFTHDCSDRTPFHSRLKPDLDSTLNRKRIDKILEATQPTMHFHGHMHTWYEWENRVANYYTNTYGLECDGMFSSWGLLDTNTNKFEFTPKKEK